MPLQLKDEARTEKMNKRLWQRIFPGSKMGKIRDIRC